MRNVQDEGRSIPVQRRDRKATRYATEEEERHARTEFNYENGYLYYKRAYEKERRKNEKYRQTVIYAAAGIFLLLHAAELILLAAIYTL